MIDNESEDQAIVAAELRRHDRDRFLTSMFAPAEARPHLWALYAFNADLARIKDTVSEPMLGEIRLQWWRDSIKAMAEGGPVPEQPLARLLAAAMASGHLSAERLQGMVDARASELYADPIADMAMLERYAAHTAGAVSLAALKLLGPGGDALAEAAEATGIAWGLAGILRSALYDASQGRSFFPQDRMAAHGVTVGDLARGTAEGKTRALAGEIADLAQRHLERARGTAEGHPKEARSVFMLAALADRDLRAMARRNFDLGLDYASIARGRRLMRLYWAGMTGRI